MSQKTDFTTPACAQPAPLPLDPVLAPPAEPPHPNGETARSAEPLATSSPAMPLTYHDLLLDARIRQRVEWCYNSGHPVPDSLQQAIDSMDYMSERWLNDDVGRSVDRIRLWINSHLRRECDEPALILVGEQVRLHRPCLTAQQLSCLPITEIAAILFQSEAPASANDAAPKTTAGSMTWQEAAERLERLRGHGEPFTSQSKLAEAFGCSSATINKAIKNTPSLQNWAKPPGASQPSMVAALIRRRKRDSPSFSSGRKLPVTTFSVRGLLELL